jgi:hypothetical protein
MTEGVFIGGWGYILAAYLITWASLVAYAVSLVARTRRKP